MDLTQISTQLSTLQNDINAIRLDSRAAVDNEFIIVDKLDKLQTSVNGLQVDITKITNILKKLADHNNIDIREF